MLIELLSFFAIICIAYVLGKLITKIKLPAILGWLLTGILFGPYLVNIMTNDIINSVWYKNLINFLECFAGVMIGREIIIKKLAKSGKQIIGITIIQSLGTFLFVSLIFSIVFLITKTPIFLAFIFGGIALATAPAPALSIVNEYKTSDPVTKTLIPLAAIDDVIGVCVFFIVISIVSSINGSSSNSIYNVIFIVLLPFIIGIIIGFICSLILKHLNNKYVKFIFFIFCLCLSTTMGLIIEYFFPNMSLNYLLIGMSFSAVVANMIPENNLNEIMKPYNPILNISLLIVIVNLGMPLDYRLIAGAGLFTIIYILSRAIGKISFSYFGGKITKADKNVTKYLGFTLLPHSGVSLVFTGIAVNTLMPIDESLASIISGTIVAAAIINEIIAVITAKYAFILAKEIPYNQK